MIIRIEELKSVCSKISTALDASENDQIAGLLQLKTKSTYLYLTVSNLAAEGYIVSSKINVHDVEDFNVTIPANLFLKLIASTTSDTVEFKINEHCLTVIGNGTYKLPIAYGDNGMIEIPELEINNVTQQFNIGTDILNSLLTYNSKELTKNPTAKKSPLQKKYYIDEEGCITFTTSACINKFELPCPIKLLLSQRIVKLFKLFTDSEVAFTLGQDVEDGKVVTKAKFKDSSTEIVTLLNLSNVMDVPASKIRGRVFSDYAHVVSVNRLALLGAIKRIMLFLGPQSVPYGKFEFGHESVIVRDFDESNSDEVYYEGDSELNETYNATLDLVDLRATLDGCSEPYVVLKFGNKEAFVVARGNNIFNVIPEIV